jgi:ABC-type Fe3+ transport system permease subunit
MHSISIVCAALLLLALYVLPSYIALRRNHRRQSSIIIVDLLLGWSFVGWLAALAWSLTGNVKNKRRKR